jgi:hypothetical protein
LQLSKEAWELRHCNCPSKLKRYKGETFEWIVCEYCGEIYIDDEEKHRKEVEKAITSLKFVTEETHGVLPDYPIPINRDIKTLLTKEESEIKATEKTYTVEIEGGMIRITGATLDDIKRMRDQLQGIIDEIERERN